MATRRSRHTMWICILMSFIMTFIADYYTPANIVVPFLYIPIILVLGRQEADRRDVWVACAATVTLNFLGAYFGEPVPTGQSEIVMWSNRLIVSAVLLLTAYLIDKQKRSESQLLLMESFIAKLIHELRNSITPIQIYSKILNKNSDSSLKIEALEAMSRQIDYITHLSDYIFDVISVKEGVAHFKPERAELSEVIQNAIDMSNPQIKSKKQTLTVNTQSNIPPINLDKILVSQLFSNIILNASKFTPDSGSIDVDIRRNGEYIVASVRDNGHGILPESLPKMFNLFARGEISPSTKGLGVGLALVKEIVKLHHGTVTVRSDGLDKGSEFTVSLPIA